MVKKGLNPKQFWVEKEWTFKQVHLEVFKQLRHLIGIWVDLKDPASKLKEGVMSDDLPEDLPAVPFRPAEWDAEKVFTRADFDALSDVDAFNMCMPGMLNGPMDRELAMPELDQMPYQLKLVDNSGYYQECYYCNDKKCDNCPFDFTEEHKMSDLLEKADLKANNNLYSSDRYGGGQKEVQIEAVWNN